MGRLEQEVEYNIARYAGGVLVNRALCDSRDMLKPSARMLMYSQIETTKNLSNKPYIKCARVVGDAIGRWYTHGDGSCYGTYARMAKPYAMRYPLEDFHGNYGTLGNSGKEAAMRYTEIRLSPLGERMFSGVKKNTIDEWEFNFDETEQYPRISTTCGFYNIVNGCTGIGYGASSQIPQFNLNEVNAALIKLLQNPDICDEDLICMPDFATGAILLNKDEVKESLLKGTGKACKLRSVIEYDAKTRTLKVTELPYGVYSDVVCKQIEEYVNENENCGIEGINDMSARNADIEIYLSKGANVDKVLKLLYKNTSLQYYSGINMTMLQNGRFPRVFTWKEALQSHINHEKIVYRRGFEYDLNKIKSRLHILNGILICCARIDEVIATIKSSSSSAAANEALQKKFLLDDVQAKAVLDMKLARLAHLEVKKLEDERDELGKEAARIEKILNSEELFNNELIRGWKEVAEKFGDARRTKILNLEGTEDEPTEVRQLQISLTNKGNLCAIESSTLYTQRRGGVGAKAKLDKGEYVIHSVTSATNDTMLLFSKSGNYYHLKASEIPLDTKMPVCVLLKISENEVIKTITPYKPKENILFFTKNGIIKKSLLSEYNTTRAVGVKALNLDSDDEIVDILFTDNEQVGILTENGHFLMIRTDDIRAIGRTARGVQGIKLETDDRVASARIIKPSAKEIISVSGLGYIKRTPITEFATQGKNTKGAKIQKLIENDWMADFLPINDLSEVLVSATSSCIRIKMEEVPRLSKGAIGNKAIKMAMKDNVIGLE